MMVVNYDILLGYLPSVVCILIPFLYHFFTDDPRPFQEGHLTFYARYGRNLPDKDPWPFGDSDPYLLFIAYDHNGVSTTKRSMAVRGNNNPDWNESIDFGTDKWKMFTVSVLDQNVFNLDKFLFRSKPYYLSPSSSSSSTNVRLDGNGGYIVFDYKNTQ